MLGAVVWSVDIPPVFLHLIGIVVMSDEQTMTRDILVPTCLLAVFQDEPFHTCTRCTVWLAVDEARLVVGDRSQGNILRVFHLYDVLALLHPSHLHTLECHQARRSTAIVVVATRGIKAVGTRIDTLTITGIIGVVHILETQHMTELMGEGSDTIHRWNYRSTWHTYQLGRTGIVVNLYAIDGGVVIQIPAVWPDVITIGSTCLAISGIDYVAVVHDAIAIVIKLAEIQIRIVLLGEFHSLLHHVAWVGICTAGTAAVATIVGCWLGKGVWTHYLEVRDKLTHGIVAVVILHTTRTAVLAVARLVQPVVEVLLGVSKHAILEVNQDHQILRFLDSSLSGSCFGSILAGSHDAAAQELVRRLLHDRGFAQDVGSGIFRTGQ